ncbi:MAG: hypothetical protein HY900_09870 [Deltaproteobacteria bacterium]|nr:hypothetical protein [Deltaproteobacteria bacterium]
MRKITIALAALLLPAAAFAAQGIVGDCVDCHTMHNSEKGLPVAKIGTSATTTVTPVQNLLKYDCIACHANPSAGGKLWTLGGGSVVPQVSHSAGSDMLAGGNFAYSTTSQRKGHNVIDITPADNTNATQREGTSTVFGSPPGNAKAHYHGETAGVFTTTGSTTAFNAFTCAGARGCHGTRSQVLSGSTGDWDGNTSTPNTFQGVRRTGIAAVSGAHHASFDGAKTDAGYTVEAAHNGAKVAAGYRMIPGLKAYGNETDRWQNVNASSHNEYFATQANVIGAGDISAGVSGGSCGDCHIEGNTTGGLSSRASFTSTMKVPGNDMSGFCATCHGVFHSAGTGDLNGTSGAFLRHPSDWVIPNTSEYAGYTSYDVSAPVARPAVATSASATVNPGTDMVMCLSCHAAHATQYDYMLRGDYTAMTAGGYANVAAAKAAGFCQACHTVKGVLPQNR